jgi:hypothetical protein
VNGKQGSENSRGPANDSRLRSGSHDPEGQVRWVAGDNLLRQMQVIDRLFDLAT